MNNDNLAAGLSSFPDTGAAIAAEAAARAFEIAGDRIERTLINAAKTGELSFSDMAESILKDLAKLAITQLITDPLQAVLPTFGGGASSGLAPSVASGPVSITLNVSGVTDAAGFSKSQGQISAALARAVSDGQRFF